MVQGPAVFAAGPLSLYNSAMCSVDICTEPAYCKGMCMKHYNAQKWVSYSNDETKYVARSRTSQFNDKLRASGEWPECIRARNLKQLYNMTIEEYESLLSGQGGRCAICGEPPKEKRLHVDHDHDCCSGRKSCGSCIRGLLCPSCNTMLGKIERKPDILESTVRYLGVNT